MTTSTLTDKGQTTVPQEVRKALKIKARQRLQWTIQNDGTVEVRPQPSALDLFGSLPIGKQFKGVAAERAGMMQAVASRVTKKSKD